MKLKLLAALLLVFFAAGAQVPSYQVTTTSGSAGYYFLMPALIFPGPSVPHTQMILDSTGELIYYRPFVISNTPGFTVQPNGQVSYFQGNQFTILDSNFINRDTAHFIGYTTDSHDFQILPNGHKLLLGIETVTMDLSMYSYF